jgi:hypothetical protein
MSGNSWSHTKEPHICGHYILELLNLYSLEKYLEIFLHKYILSVGNLCRQVKGKTVVGDSANIVTDQQNVLFYCMEHMEGLLSFITFAASISLQN